MPELHEPGDGSTPEIVAAYWGGRDATELTVSKIRRRSLVISLSVAVFICVVVSIFLINVYGKVSDIRSTQVHNTSVSRCQNKALNDALMDAKLAVSGDHNPADYVAPPKC